MAKIFEFDAALTDTSTATVLTNEVGNDWNVNRNSIATYKPTPETIVEVAANIARIEDGKMLIEAAFTNVIPYSNDFSQWTDTNSLFTENVVTSPDGTVNAGTFDNSGGVNNGRLIAVSQDTFTIGDEIEYKVWIRQTLGSSSQAAIRLIFLASFINESYALVTADNIWKEISLQGTVTEDVTNPQLFIRSDFAAVFDVYAAWIGKGTDIGSYMPTNGAIATRAADVITNTVPSGVAPLTLTKIVDGVESSETVTAGQALTMENGTSSIIITDSPPTTTIRTTWTDSTTTGVIGHKIYRDTVPSTGKEYLGSVGMGVQVWDDTTHEAATEYSYSVQAYSADDESDTESADNVKTITTTAVGEGAQLLFKTDFEGTVALGALTGDDKYFSGSSLGYTFPTDGQLGMGTSQNGMHLITGGSGVVDATLETVTGRLGTSTTALHSQVTALGSATQVPWEFKNITTPPNTFYCSYWMKVEADFLADDNSSGYDYRALWEYKTQNYYLQDRSSARLILHAIKLNEDEYWRLQLDNHADGQPESVVWTDRSTDAIIPKGVWFKFEVYFKYREDSTGEAWIKIDGDKVVEATNVPMTVANDPIDYIMGPQCYGASLGSSGQHQWVDDIEFWNGIPDSSVPLYGPELVTNGMFVSDLSGWTNGNSFWSWVDGWAYHPFSTSFNKLAANNVSVLLSKTYRIFFYLRIVSGTVKFTYNDSGGGEIITQYTTSGFKEIITSDIQQSTATPMGFSRMNSLSAEFYVDNVSVREVL